MDKFIIAAETGVTQTMSFLGFAFGFKSTSNLILKQRIPLSILTLFKVFSTLSASSGPVFDS